MSWLRLIIKSFKYRKLSVFLAVFSISISLILLMCVERVRRATQEGFTQTVSGVDLIVGARTSPLQLVLYSVFNIGQPTNNVTIESYNEIKNRPEIEWTIPYSLGDGHRGFRVVATNQDFFKFYRFRSQRNIEFADGKPFSDNFDVVIGSDVAKELSYQLNSKVVVAHGVTSGIAIQEHSDKPFTVVGILRPTGTPLDRALYISLSAMEAIHLDWQTGSAPAKGQEISLQQITMEMLQPKSITSFFVRTKNRIETLRLQREINDYKAEPLIAVIPGVVLNELWQTLSSVEKVFKAISFLVMLVGLFTLIIALMSSLQERRREMTILRALGASPGQILMLIEFETLAMLIMSLLLSLVFKVAIEAILSDWLQSRFGISLQGFGITYIELSYFLLVMILGLLISLIPAIKARQSVLKDGLSLKI